MNQNFKHRLIWKWRQGVNKNIKTSESGAAQVLKLFWRVWSIGIINRETALLKKKKKKITRMTKGRESSLITPANLKGAF